MVQHQTLHFTKHYSYSIYLTCKICTHACIATVYSEMHKMFVATMPRQVKLNRLVLDLPPPNFLFPSQIWNPRINTGWLVMYFVDGCVTALYWYVCMYMHVCWLICTVNSGKFNFVFIIYWNTCARFHLRFQNILVVNSRWHQVAIK